MVLRKVSFKFVAPREVRQKLKSIYKGRIIMFKDEDSTDFLSYCAIIASYTTQTQLIDSTVKNLGKCYGFIPTDISICEPSDCIIGLRTPETDIWMSIKQMNQKEVEHLFSDPRCTGHIFY